MRAGYQEHLAKPIEAAALVDAVQRWSQSPRRQPDRGGYE
jgi:FixJ family two-component response regulator